MTTPPPLPPSAPPPNPSIVEPPSFGGYAGTPGALEGVGFWPRAGARIIDMFVHFGVALFAGFFFGFVLAIVAGATGRSPEEMLAKLNHLGLASYGLALLGSLAYHTVCESVHGSTLGKLALSMVVVREDGSPCKFDSALLRSFASYIDALFFGLIGYFAMQGTPQMQRYGDQWAHTVVCKRFQIRPENLRSGGRFALALFLAMAADALLLMIGWTIAVAG